MKTQRALFGILVFGAVAGVTASPRQAQARACAGASDCPKGWDCAGPDAGEGLAGMCISLPCQSDSDCGPGLRCFIQGSSLGSGLPVSTTTPSLFEAHGSACVPEWEIACTSASDCGPGFTCPSTEGDFGGDFLCGKDQDASQPPQARVTTIPCSAVPTPLSVLGDAALSGGLQIPSICEAGTTCTEVSWNTCVAPQTAACSVDSDCPSTWTCGCETNCDGPVLGSDGGCTMICLAPSSDLFSGEVCAGGAATSFGPGGPSEPPPPTASGSGADAATPGASPTAGGATGAQGDVPLTVES